MQVAREGGRGELSQPGSAFLPLPPFLAVQCSKAERGGKRKEGKARLRPPSPLLPPLSVRANGRPPVLLGGEREEGTRNCGAWQRDEGNVSGGLGRKKEGGGTRPPADTRRLPSSLARCVPISRGASSNQTTPFIAPSLSRFTPGYTSRAIPQ